MQVRVSIFFLWHPVRLAMFHTVISCSTSSSSSSSSSTSFHPLPCVQQQSAVINLLHIPSLPPSLPSFSLQAFKLPILLEARRKGEKHNRDYYHLTRHRAKMSLSLSWGDKESLGSGGPNLAPAPDSVWHHPMEAACSKFGQCLRYPGPQCLAPGPHSLPAPATAGQRDEL